MPSRKRRDVRIQFKHPIVKPDVFSAHIERIYRESGNLHYYEAVLQACADHHIEPDDCRSLIIRPLMQKIEQEAGDLNMLKRRGERQKKLTDL